MLVPPLAPGCVRARDLSFWERRALRRAGDRDILPALAKLEGRRIRVDAPDQGSRFTGRLSSARRLQLCIELVLTEADIEGRLRLFGEFSGTLTVIRPISDVIVAEDAVLSYSPVFNLVGRAGELKPKRSGELSAVLRPIADSQGPM